MMMGLTSLCSFPCLFIHLLLCFFTMHEASMEAPPPSSPTDDMQLLLQLKSSLQTFNNNNNLSSLLSDWDPKNGNSPCGWTRITCTTNSTSSTSQSGIIVAIDLSSLYLQGPLLNLTSTFSSLIALSSLNLSHNNLNGSIPQDIANCIHLTSLDLSFNGFNSFESNSTSTTTTITNLQPQGLSSLSNLQFLHLQMNNLSSHVSLAIPHDCTHLQSLNLSGNSFTNLSSQPWQDCTSLETIDLSQNMLVDQRIPTNLTLLPSLKYLSLAKNGLGGSLPSCLPSSSPLPSPSSPSPSPPSSSSRSSALTHLDLSDNQLNGDLAPSMATTCSSLQHLDISGNKIWGSIVAELGNMSGLEVLNLSENLLEGPIPKEIGELAELQVLMLGSNSLSGGIPSELSSCKTLRLLDLNTNNLAGTIPSSLQQIPSLAYLVLHSNSFHGSIPPSLYTMHSLIFLDLSNNSLSGTLSPHISNMSSLQFLLLAHNSFHGEMPVELGQMGGLQALDLSSNTFHGSIPSSLGNLQWLLWLMLAHNNLSNSIPAHLGNCTSLLWLNLKDNSLSGQVPVELESMGVNPNATFIYNADNIHPPQALGECLMLARWIPEHYPPYSFYYSNLSDRKTCNLFWLSLFTGYPVPSGCGPTFMGYIQLTNNKLTGPIPTRFRTSMLLLSFNSFSGSLTNGSDNDGFRSLDPPLLYVNVSHNNLSGPIPESLSNIKCLALLDLSYNNFSGSIPQILGDLSQLSEFNVSYNPLLSGSIPSSGQFATFTMSSYVGDPLLCYEIVPGTKSMDNSSISIPFCDLNPSTTASSSSTKHTTVHTKILIIIVIWVGILGTSILIFGIGVGFYMIMGGKVQNDKLNFDLDPSFHNVNDEKKVHVFEGHSIDTPSLCDMISQLCYEDILKVTEGFNNANIVGSGGFGTVYKATLADGSIVAIKKLSHEGAQGERQFLAEMETMGNTSHPNLVPLLGCFTFGRDKLLFYKFLSNGNLEDFLYKKKRNKDNDDEREGEAPTWPIRLKIACQCANAMSYLHHECHPPLLHRDMKPSNILLDEHFNAYVADFGLARVLDPSDSHVSTVVAGTLGYVPPEYYHTCRATPKGDIYSFGVVMLELITGRRPLLFDDDHKTMTKHGTNGDDDTTNKYNDDSNLVDWVRRLSHDSRILDIFCPSVKGNGQDLHGLNLFLELSLACTSEAPSERPDMREVSYALEALLKVCESSNFHKEIS